MSTSRCGYSPANLGCAGVFTTETRAETWLEKSLQVDADTHTWVETKHVNRLEKDI